MAIVCVIQDGCNLHALLQCDVKTPPLEKGGGGPCLFHCKGHTVTVGEVIL